jgi:Flp pilus assembly protein TadD
MIFFVFLDPPLPAADPWTKLQTPHFELYTTAGEKKAREAILYFEQVRSFFLQASPSKRVPEFPVRIVAFRSEKEYKPYRVNEAAFAYFTRDRNHDYIVMQSIASEHYPVAIHEYTHLIVEHAGLHLPVWLNEGLADVYSTMKPVGNKIMVGDLPPGRVQALMGSTWLNLDVLAAVDHHSPLYNERDRAGKFYAESWLLAHMLCLSLDYRPNFTKLVAALSSGKSTADAFQSVLGKSLSQVQLDLHTYLSGRLYGALFDVKLEKSAEEPEASDAPAFESDMVLADLLAATRKTDEARRAYEQLAKQNPDKPEVEESLGYLAWQSGDKSAARQHFSRAVAASTKNAQMCFHYAQLEREANSAGDAGLTALQKAVDLKPDYVEARLQLGLLLMNQHNYSEALKRWSPIKSVNEDQAQWFFPAMAYAYMQTGDAERAREYAEKSKAWAKDPQQLEQVHSILRYLDQQKAAVSARNTAPAPSPAATDSPVPTLRRPEPGPPPETKEISKPNPFVKQGDQMSRVEGVAQRLECIGESARFHVLVAGKPMIFDIPDATSVLIKHSGETKHDFVCGPQKPFRVIVDYAVQSDAKRGSAGIVRGLEF